MNDTIEKSLRNMYELGKKHAQEDQIALINQETKKLNDKLDAMIKDLKTIRENIIWEK